MIKVYTGCMFSGKSLHMIVDYDMIYDKTKIKCFKPSKDKRDTTFIKSRKSIRKIEATVISDFSEILKNINENIEYIFIDEVQFITGDIQILNKLSLEGKIIIVSGLNKTSELKPFGCMPNILSIADEINILKAICEDCGGDAYFTYSLKPKKEDVECGDKDKYIPLCRTCYAKRLKER